MTAVTPDTDPDPNSTSRRLACLRCGMEFSCDLNGNCWCAAEDVRLPIPVDGGDCLCPGCLRAMAANASAFRSSPDRLLPASEHPE